MKNNQIVLREIGKYKIVPFYANVDKDLSDDYPVYGDIYCTLEDALLNHQNEELIMGFGIVDTNGISPEWTKDWYWTIESATKDANNLK